MPGHPLGLVADPRPTYPGPPGSAEVVTLAIWLDSLSEPVI